MELNTLTCIEIGSLGAIGNHLASLSSAGPSIAQHGVWGACVPNRICICQRPTNGNDNEWRLE